jgi:hypothetical protein
MADSNDYIAQRVGPFQRDDPPWSRADGLLHGIEKVWPLFLAQEEWDLSEFQQLFQKNWGKDAWQFLVIECGDRPEWVWKQKPRWSQLPLCLRQDKEYYIGEFGEVFVKNEWPILYWRDQRPHFWRSREACRELFGDHFMETYWGKLYWEIEVPPFWHSWKNCQNFFGKYFVKYDWPFLLQERSFDHAEGHGACQYLSKCFSLLKLWGYEDREKWIMSMVDRWRPEDEDLRHSR